jgi:hypothetical protein
MDYAEQVKTVNLVDSFTYFEYLKLKRKPPKVETKPETGAETGAETNNNTSSTDARM